MLRRIAENFLMKFGYELVKSNNSVVIPADIEDEYHPLIKAVKPYTMTSPERIYALIRSVEYLVDNSVSGSIVECGVWKGGSIQAAIKVLQMKKDLSRPIYLFDTFEGMPKPDNIDVFHTGESAQSMFEEAQLGPNKSDWCYASLDEVRANILRTGYPESNIHFIQGMVQRTIPEHAPDKIGLLRLDTDFYSSTFHELEFLYPRLVDGGILIIDDYGCWSGCKLAVDEFFSKNNTKMLLHRLDHTGRIGIKQERNND